MASAVPRYGPGHEQTQSKAHGPEGEPPLMSIRSLAATATDGRWEWYESGAPFDFEVTDRYAARRKRDRFNGELLLDYLAHLSIPARNDSAYDRQLTFAKALGLAPREADEWPTPEHRPVLDATHLPKIDRHRPSLRAHGRRLSASFRLRPRSHQPARPTPLHSRVPTLDGSQRPALCQGGLGDPARRRRGSREP